MINLPMTIRLYEDMGEVRSELVDWIPVTEDLPDRDDDYLVTVKNDCGTRRRQVSSFRLFNDGTCYSWGIETSPVYTVVAWAEMMPMWEE